MNYITKTEAFAHHGATLTAPRGVWAKKSDDGKLVVLAAWRKGFNRDPFLPGKASYTFGDGSPNPTSNRGRKEFIELMNWAIENCEGMIKAVVSEAKDWDHHPHDFVGGVPLLGKALKIVDFEPEGSCFLMAKVIDFPEEGRPSLGGRTAGLSQKSQEDRRL